MVKIGVTDKPKKRVIAVTQMNGLENSHLIIDVSILSKYL